MGESVLRPPTSALPKIHGEPYRVRTCARLTTQTSRNEIVVDLTITCDLQLVDGTRCRLLGYIPEHNDVPLQHGLTLTFGSIGNTPTSILPSLQRAMYGTAVGLVPSLTPADGCGGQLLGHTRLSWCLLEGV